MDKPRHLRMSSWSLKCQKTGKTVSVSQTTKRLIKKMINIDYKVIIQL